MAKTINRRPTDAERRLQRMADFVTRVLEKLDVGYNNGRITIAMYNEATQKLDNIGKILQENNDLWNEAIFADEYFEEADKDVKKQVADTIREYEEYVTGLTREYETLISNINETNKKNIDAICVEFSNKIADLEKTYNVATIQKRFADLNNKIKGLEGQLEDAKAENVVLKENLARTEQKSADKTRKIQSDAKTSYKTQDSLNRAQATIMQQNLELQDVKERLEESLTKINEKDTRIKELARELEETRASVRRGSIRVQKLQAQIKDLEDQVADLNRGIEVLEKQYPEYLEEIKRSICQQVICEKFGLSDDQTTGFARAEGLYKARKKAKKDKTYDEKIKQTVNKLKEDYPPNWFSNTTNEDVEKVINNTVSKIPARIKKAVVCGIAATAVVVGSLTYVVFGLGNQNAKTTEQLNIAQNEVLDVTDKWDKANSINNDLSKDKQHLQNKVNDLTEEKKEQNSTIKEQEDIIKEHESTIKDKDEVIEEQTGIIDNLTNENTKLEEENKNLEKENESLKEEVSAPTIQIFDIDGSVCGAKVQLESAMSGTLQHVDIMYNSETGNIQVVAKAKKGKNEKLMIGTGTLAQGSDYTKEGSDLIDNQIKNVTFGEVYVKNQKDDVWYKVRTQQTDYGYQATGRACVVEVDANGIISIKESAEMTIAINSENEEDAIDAAKEAAFADLEKMIGTTAERD